MTRPTLFLLLLSFGLMACQPNTGQAQKEATSTESTAVISEVLNAEAFKQKMEELPNALLLDVRTPEEFSEGAFEGAVNYDFYAPEFRDLIDSLDRAQPVLLYCRSGGRSGKTAAMMKQMGFKEVYDLAGGYSEWPY